jgi:hypothetical protein
MPTEFNRVLYKKAADERHPGCLGVYGFKNGKWSTFIFDIKKLGRQRAWQLAKECASDVEARMQLTKPTQDLRVEDLLDSAAAVWVAVERAEREAQLPALALAADGAYAKSFIVDAFTWKLVL